MTPRPALVFLGASVAVLAGAVGLLAHAIATYFGSAHAVSSTSGDHIYRYGDQLLGLPTFALGAEPMIVGLSILPVLAALLVAAVTWKSAA